MLIKNGFVAKFNQAGERIWGTYYNGENVSSSVKVLPYGNSNHFYLAGTTASNSAMTTSDGLQPNQIISGDQYWQTHVGISNIFITHFSPIIEDEGGNDVGINENSDQDYSISLFPNPVGSYVHLRWKIIV